MRSHYAVSVSSSTGSARRASLTAAPLPPAPRRERQMTPPATHKADSTDVRCATLLSELVYRAAESADESAFRQAQLNVEQAVGARLNHVRCHKSGGQRFLVGETQDAIYVAFQGTKSAIDWLANLNFFHGHFGWNHHHHHSASSTSSSGSGSLSTASSSNDLSTASSINSRSSSFSSTRSRSSSSRAHIGFLKRANSAAVSISELHAAAAASGKRLVLTGHSLGGAVAVLTTVRLLRSLAAGQAAGTTSEAASLNDLNTWDNAVEPRVRCISFATPAMANSDLLQEVTAAGWDKYITNILLPEDPVVPFVNLLLNAPASPSKPAAQPPRGLFAGLDSPSASPTPSSTSSSSGASHLTRSNSNESHISLSAVSWAAAVQLEPSLLSSALAAAGASVAASAEQLQETLQTATDNWLDHAASELSLAEATVGRSLSLALMGDVPCLQPSASGAAADAAPALEGSSGSRELASWLADARDAVRQDSGPQPSPRSLQNSSRANSNSGTSLFSLQSDAFASWPPGSSEDDSSDSSNTPSPTRPSLPHLQVSGYSFGMPVVASWALDTSSSISSLSSDLMSPQPAAASSDTELLQLRTDSTVAADTAAKHLRQQQQGPAQGSSEPRRHNLGAKVVRQLQRVQQQLAGTRVGRLAWIGGALAAGARCAAALAAPTADVSHSFSLLALLPRALAGPAALAVLHFVGHAAYQAALPPSHPLGQQLVLTGSGLEPVAKPLKSYPRTGEDLGLKELGGLFPGHRMIAYRRRLATLVSQNTSESPQL